MISPPGRDPQQAAGIIADVIWQLGMPKYIREGQRTWVQAEGILLSLGEAAVLPLCDKLRDSSPWTAYRAAEILGDIGDGRAAKPLCEALELFEGRKEEMESPALNLYRVHARFHAVSGPWWLDAPARALVKIGEPAVFPACDLLKRSSSAHYVAYREVLARARTDHPKLIEKAQDARFSSSHVAYAAAWVLGEIRDPRAVTPLCEVLGLLDDQAEERVSEALIRIGRPSVSALCRALESTFQPAACQAAKALGKIRDTHSVLPLCKALSYPNSVVANYAAEALGAIGDPRAVAPLCQALSGGGAAWTEYLATALAKIGAPAIAALCEALKGPGCYGAAMALHQLAVSAPTPALRSALPQLRSNLWRCFARWDWESIRIHRRAIKAIEAVTSAQISR